MRSLEKEANARGLDNRQLMLNAGSKLAHFLLDLFAESENRMALGLVGPGNNGGDTLVALNVLIDEGWSAAAYLVKDRSEKDEWLSSFVQKGGEVIQAGFDKDYQKLDDWLIKAEMVLDGVLGTGVHLPLEKEISSVLSRVSEFPDRPFTIAVDCPSGVDCESGQAADECIPADLTLCFGAVKSGLLKFPAFEYVGDLYEVLIGLSDDLPTWKKVFDQVIDASMVSMWLPNRRLDANKGNFGRLLIAAGSRQYPGTVLLAGRAAYRMGVGLLRMAIPEQIQPMLAGQFPEATWLPLPGTDGSFTKESYSTLIRHLEKIKAMLIGPGWGNEESVFEFLDRLLKFKKLPSLVIDAEGLRHLMNIPEWSKRLPEGSVLTPHPGEMSALTGLSISSIQNDRVEIARKFAVQWECVVVLKGALTIVASPNGRVMTVPIATSALAHAGTGDVLAGMVASLLAQGLDGFQAASAAAWLHARAGQIAEEDLGTPISVMASDVIDRLPQVLSMLI